ncbi:hypothetical protein HpBhutan227_06820 [Helicobacter pylori]
MANESIEGKAYQLKDILATELSAYYQIPIYQRPYQWTEKNCEKLLDDLLSSYECYKESDYFLRFISFNRNWHRFQNQRYNL